MTREEMENIKKENAIKDLKEFQIDISSSSDDLEQSPLYYALDMAIQALEQQPCENCIGKEALINELKLGYFNKELQKAKNDACVIDAMIDWAIRTVKRQPSVTPKGVTVTDFADRCRECGKDIKQIYISKILDKVRAELIQSIQNGTLKIESGNEELFRIIDKYKESEEV